MIVETCGTATRVRVVEAKMQAFASATGTAYTKKGVARSVVRVIRKVVKFVIEKVTKFVEPVCRVFMSTRTGKPTSIDPPATQHI